MSDYSEQVQAIADVSVAAMADRDDPTQPYCIVITSLIGHRDAEAAIITLIPADGPDEQSLIAFAQVQCELWRKLHELGGNALIEQVTQLAERQVNRPPRAHRNIRWERGE